MTVTLSKVTITLEVTVTSNDMAICLSSQSDRHFVKKWKLKNNAQKMWNCQKSIKKAKKFFWKFWKWRSLEVTSFLMTLAICSSFQSDGHLWKSDRHFFKVTSRWPKPMPQTSNWSVQNIQHFDLKAIISRAAIFLQYFQISLKIHICPGF